MTKTKNGLTARGEINKSNVEFRPLKIRWVMLTIFILFTFVNSLQWGQYIIISDSVMKYYSVTGEQVDNTMVIYMVAYIPLIFPALWLLNKMGTRFCMILGCAGLCAGGWIKVYGSMARDRFTWVMVGQSFQATFQVLAFGLAAKVSALWFGADEVSLACALAVFGDQLGSAFGFLLPSFVMVKTTNDENVLSIDSNSNSTFYIVTKDKTNHIDDIGSSLKVLNFYISIITTFILISAFLFFRNKPKIPSSAAQAIQRQSEDLNIIKSIKTALKGKSFPLMMVSYGINVASFNAYVALFNAGFLKYFPKTYEDHIGYITFLMMIAGIISSILIGYLFDKTHLFKELTLLVYMCSFIIMLANIFILRLRNLALLYVSNILIGFFMIAYYSVGIQLGIELKFPLSEGFISSLLLLASHILGIPFSKIYRHVYDTSGDTSANIFLCVALLLGTYLTYLVPSKLRRQGVEKKTRSVVIN